MKPKRQLYEMDIDVKEIVLLLFHELPLILGIAFLFFLTSGIISFFIPSEYESSTEIYVLEKQNNNTRTFSDLEMGSKLTMDYSELIQDRQVMEETIHKLHLDMDCEDLQEKINVTIPPDTRILRISVMDSSPIQAMHIANTVREIATEHIQSVSDIKAINPVTSANLPTKRATPNIKKNALVAGLFGGLLTIVFLLIRYFLDDTIKTSEDVKKYLECSTLTMIPDGSNQTKSIQFQQAEAYKILRANLKFMGKDAKVIGITSSIPGEGKSTVAYELAKVLAQDHKRVTLVDADLRKSTLQSHLYHKKTLGLSHYLSQQATLDQVLVQDHQFPIIFAGTVPPNPSELIGSKRFSELLERLKKTNDYVLVDTAPAGTVSDGLLACKNCDNVILVTASGKVSWHYVKNVKDQLNEVGIPILGVVLNKTDHYLLPYDKYNTYSDYYGEEVQ